MCIGEGRYCLTFPNILGVTLNLHSETKAKLKGNFFEELIRSRCVSKNLLGKFQMLWFEYMLTYLERCFKADPVTYKFVTSACANSILDTLEIPVTDINECIRNSYTDPGNSNSMNTILEEDSALEGKLNVRATP